MGILEQAIVELRRWRDCPACGRPVSGTACAACGLPLAGEGARQLIQQSEAAARALELRQRTLAQLAAARPPGSVPLGSAGPLAPAARTARS